MDIKGALNQILPIQIRAKDSAPKSIKSDSTTDRDANGQQAFQEQKQQQHPPMTEEEFKKALDHIKGLPVVTDHNLLVEVLMNPGGRLITLSEPNGKIVRRISEQELWTLQIMTKDPWDKGSIKGQILNKSA